MAMTCYTDWKFVKAGRFGQARNLLKYLQYRDDAINHIPRAGGPQRWVDCGLGGSWREILDAAAELQSRKVLMRTLVIRPPQELVAQLKEVDPERWGQRRDLMAELVDRVVDAEMDRTGLKLPDGRRQPLDLPYAYVIHAPDDGRGVESTHAHVVLPGMDREGEHPFNVYPGDQHLTRQVAEREAERLFALDRLRDLEPELDLGAKLERGLTLNLER
jgi:hypothetical protein